MKDSGPESPDAYEVNIIIIIIIQHSMLALN